MLTGNKDVDLIILSKLEDTELVNICQTNKAANELCNNQGFWYRRIQTKFPNVGIDILKQYKGDRTWSRYYIDNLRKINRTNAQPYLFDGSRNGRLDQVMVAISKGANPRAQNDYAVINASISNNDLRALIWNWNGTNTSLYDASLALMMNFNNYSVLGENSTFIRDLSVYGNNGSIVGGASYVPGKYGLALDFDGSSEYVNLGQPAS